MYVLYIWRKKYICIYIYIHILFVLRSCSKTSTASLTTTSLATEAERPALAGGLKRRRRPPHSRSHTSLVVASSSTRSPPPWQNQQPQPQGLRNSNQRLGIGRKQGTMKSNMWPTKESADEEDEAREVTFPMEQKAPTKPAECPPQTCPHTRPWAPLASVDDEGEEAPHPASCLPQQASSTFDPSHSHPRARRRGLHRTQPAREGEKPRLSKHNLSPNDF